MKVYVVVGRYNYGSDALLAVFETEEEAQAYREEYKDKSHLCTFDALECRMLVLGKAYRPWLEFTINDMGESS